MFAWFDVHAQTGVVTSGGQTSEGRRCGAREDEGGLRGVAVVMDEVRNIRSTNLKRMSLLVFRSRRRSACMCSVFYYLWGALLTCMELIMKPIACLLAAVGSLGVVACSTTTSDPTADSHSGITEAPATEASLSVFKLTEDNRSPEMFCERFALLRLRSGSGTTATMQDAVWGGEECGSTEPEGQPVTLSSVRDACGSTIYTGSYETKGGSYTIKVSDHRARACTDVEPRVAVVVTEGKKTRSYMSASGALTYELAGTSSSSVAARLHDALYAYAKANPGAGVALLSDQPSLYVAEDRSMSCAKWTNPETLGAEYGCHLTIAPNGEDSKFALESTSSAESLQSILFAALAAKGTTSIADGNGTRIACEQKNASGLLQVLSWRCDFDLPMAKIVH
jgi:hypothetical protein